MKTFKEVRSGRLEESYYAVVDKNGIIQFKGSKSIAKKKLKDHPGGFIGNTVSKGVGDKWKTEDMSLAPKGKGREAAKKLYKAAYEDLEVPNKENELDEISIAQTQQRRRNRKLASLQKSMAKYRAASKAGIHPSKVHQRRTKLTVKKG